MRTLLTGIMAIDGEDYRVQVTNLSAQGACIEFDGELELDEVVQLTISELGECSATVRWLSEGEYGLIFEHTLPFEHLARLAAALAD
jgi:hypothetical protein